MSVVPAITIPLSEYKRLLKSELKLEYLEGFGVDNWSGYDEALSGDLDGQPTYREACKFIDEELES